MRPTFILAAVLAAAPAAAQDGDPARGESLFARNCAACHGGDAAGGGPMTEVLSIATPDLTGLAERADGTFPVGATARRIDGRDLILAHGGPMPLFGHILEEQSAVVDGPEGEPVFTSQAVLDIVSWLATIQR